MTTQEEDEKEFEEWFEKEWPRNSYGANWIDGATQQYMRKSWLASRRTLREKGGRDEAYT